MNSVKNTDEIIYKKEIVLATTNPGKITDYETLFSHYPIRLRKQEEFQLTEVEETGLTFVENAILKARNACLATGLSALGDDGGLIVDALQGEPGLYSARYAGYKATPQENIEKLLTELNKIPNAARTARLYLVIVYLRHAKDPAPVICEGSWELEVMHEPRGNLGFGYLPILFEPRKKCGAAELPLEERNKINHRSKAFQKLIQSLGNI